MWEFVGIVLENCGLFLNCFEKMLGNVWKMLENVDLLFFNIKFTKI